MNGDGETREEQEQEELVQKGHLGTLGPATLVLPLHPPPPPPLLERVEEVYSVLQHESVQERASRYISFIGIQGVKIGVGQSEGDYFKGARG